MDLGHDFHGLTQCSDIMCAEVVCQADKDNDAEINFEEFLLWCLDSRWFDGVGPRGRFGPILGHPRLDDVPKDGRNSHNK